MIGRNALWNVEGGTRPELGAVPTLHRSTEEMSVGVMRRNSSRVINKPVQVRDTAQHANNLTVVLDNMVTIKFENEAVVTHDCIRK